MLRMDEEEENNMMEAPPLYFISPAATSKWSKGAEGCKRHFLLLHFTLIQKQSDGV